MYKAKTLAGASRLFRASVGHLGMEIIRAIDAGPVGRWVTRTLAPGPVTLFGETHAWDCDVASWWHTPDAWPVGTSQPGCSCGRVTTPS